MVESSYLNKFVEFISKEEIEIKQDAIKLIPKIACEISTDKLFNEFFPFVQNSIDDEDENLISEFLSIIPSILSIENNKSNSHKLLSFIEIGLISYNSKIREEALAMYKIILKEAINANKDYDVYEFVQKLSSSIHQKYRIAFLLVIPIVYKHLNSSQKGRIASFLKQFSNEGTEYLKKMLAINLKELSFFIPEDVFSTICNNLLESSNDNIRIPLIGSIISLKYHQNLNQFQNQIQKVVTSIGKDNSWRVRYTLASSVHDLLSFSIISPTLKKEIVSCYSQLFLDPEQEVRNISILNLGSALEKLKDDSDSINILIDSFEKSFNFELSHIVKETVADSIVSISKYVGKPKLKSVIVPICYELLKYINKDEPSHTPTPMNRTNVTLSPVIEKKKIVPSTSPIMTKKSLPHKSHGELLESYLGKGNMEKSNKKNKEVIVYDNSGNCGQFTQVQIKILKNIPAIQKLSQNNFESAVLSSINSIFSSGKWKSKVNLLETVYDIISYFSQQALANEILDLLLKGLQENVYLIRESSIKCLVEVHTKISNDEVNLKVVKALNTLRQSTNYQMRKCCALFMLAYVKKKSSNDNFISNNLITIITTNLVKDKVKNIKAICGLIISCLCLRNKSYQSKLTKIIEEYTNDSDDEVKRSILI